MTRSKTEMRPSTSHRTPPIGPAPGMTVVFDTNVIVEAIFWPRSTARRALAGLDKRRFKSVINSAILEEYATITAEVREELFSESLPSGALSFHESLS
jgi:predicted nucleic acid-binding protein